MDRHRWPYDPHAPPRDPRDDWVVVGDESAGGPADRLPPRPDEHYPAPYADPQPQPHPPAGWYGPPAYEPGWNDSAAYGAEGYAEYEGRHSQDGLAERPTTGYPLPPDRPYPPPGRPYLPPAPARPYLPPVSGPAYPPPAAPASPAAWNPPAGPPPPRRASGPVAGPPPARAGPPGRTRPAAPAPEPVDDEDEDDEALPESSWQTVVAWTACFFLVPMLLYLAWALTRSGAVPSGCVDATGVPCMSPRAIAISRLVTVGPALGGAFALAMFASLGLRWLTATWRPSTVGFAAAIIGAGLATLVARIVGF